MSLFGKKCYKWKTRFISKRFNLSQKFFQQMGQPTNGPDYHTSSRGAIIARQRGRILSIWVEVLYQLFCPNFSKYCLNGAPLIISNYYVTAAKPASIMSNPQKLLTFSVTRKDECILHKTHKKTTKQFNYLAGILQELLAGRCPVTQ